MGIKVKLKQKEKTIEDVVSESEDLEANIKRLERLAEEKKAGLLIKNSGEAPDKNIAWQNSIRENFGDKHEIFSFSENDFRLDANSKDNRYRIAVVAVDGKMFFISLHYATAAIRTIEMDYVPMEKLIDSIAGIINLFKTLEGAK